MNEKFKKAFLWLFVVLYTCIAFVSTYHAIAFFGLSNPVWLAVVLAISFEVGQAGVLFSILTDPTKTGKKPLPWILMSILTIVQCLGNIFSSYKPNRLLYKVCIVLCSISKSRIQLCYDILYNWSNITRSGSMYDVYGSQYASQRCSTTNYRR